MKKNFETVLENFIKNEIETTTSRIATIKLFVDTLKEELMKYTAYFPFEKEDREKLTLTLKFFRSMISTYEEEIKLLVIKRDKMLEHLVNVRTIAMSLTSYDGKEEFKPYIDLKDIRIN